MRKTIEAVYEKGMIKPLEQVALAEFQRIRVTIETRESSVALSQTLIPASPAVVGEVADSEDYQLYGS